ncbi:MAG TPA: ABC transporter permease [Vicinamibacterales bacterium]|nr:ABC transporter permease [Vicinamibacterales bacterium]
MIGFASDLRYAFRAVFKNPRFSLVAVAALALGIGANAAIFSVVNAVLLQPLPYPEAHRLVRLCRQFDGPPQCAESIPKFVAWSRAQAFGAIAAYDFAGPGLNLGGGDRPEQIKGIHVSAGYFRVFGAAPEAGRTFTPQEDAPGGPRAVVITHKLWQSRFAGDTAMAGRTITLNGDSYTVIGILPAAFRSEPPADVFIPLQADPNSTNHGNYLSVAAHLKPGATIASAQAEMNVLAAQFRQDNPKWITEQEKAGVFGMLDIAVGNVRPALLILLGAVGLVLLIACANVANLLLARAAGRQREVAIRAAIGASRAQIVRQLLLESLLLATAGAVTGVIAGVWGARGLLSLSPGDLPRAGDFAQGTFWSALLDWRVVAFAVGVSLVTAVLFGLAPAVQLARTELGQTLKDAGGRGASNRKAARTRNALVVVETALALMLLVGAALLIRTFVALREVKPGFESNGVLTLQTSLAGAKYSNARDVDTLARTVTARLGALPGVEAVAMAITLPTEGGVDLPFAIEGRPLTGSDQYHGDENWRSITPQYFKALSIPVLRGRAFEDRDAPGTAPVVIVSNGFAKKYFPGADAIGQRVIFGKGLGPEFEDPVREIVGIVGDTRDNGLDADPPAMVYVPVAQVPDGLTRLGNSVIPPRWVLKTSAPLSSLTGIVQREFLAVDGQLAVAQVRSMADLVSTSIARQSFNMLLLTIFGAIALLLAAVGVYGIMSYSVEQGTHDISVRLALGADRRDILSLVVGQGMKLAGIGLAAGTVAALGASRLLARMLYGVKASDPQTYAIAIGVLGAIALAACCLPARRAMRLDPVSALKQD